MAVNDHDLCYNHYEVHKSEIDPPSAITTLKSILKNLRGKSM